MVTCREDMIDVRCSRFGTSREGMEGAEPPSGNPRFSEQLVENLYSKWLSGGLPITNAASGTYDEQSRLNSGAELHEKTSI